MMKMIAVRLDGDLLAEVDAARRRAGTTRAKVVHDALALWIERQRLEDAIRRDQDGYAKKPIRKDEFGPVLGAQVWGKSREARSGSSRFRGLTAAGRSSSSPART